MTAIFPPRTESNWSVRFLSSLPRPQAHARSSLQATYLEDAYGVETDGYNVLEHHSNQVKQTRRTAVAARQQKDTARRLAAARRRAQQAGTTPSRRRHTFQQHSSRLSQAHVPSSSPEHDEARALGRRRASRDGDFRRAWLYFQREY